MTYKCIYLCFRKKWILWRLCKKINAWELKHTNLEHFECPREFNFLKEDTNECILEYVTNSNYMKSNKINRISIYICPYIFFSLISNWFNLLIYQNDDIYLVIEILGLLYLVILKISFNNKIRKWKKNKFNIKCIKIWLWIYKK